MGGSSGRVNEQRKLFLVLGPNREKKRDKKSEERLEPVGLGTKQWQTAPCSASLGCVCSLGSLTTLRSPTNGP